jgi:hypothetical protein
MSVSVPTSPPPPCTWTENDYASSDAYDTSCGRAFQFTDDSPSANGFRFCPFCGGELIEERFVECDLIDDISDAQLAAERGYDGDL